MSDIHNIETIIAEFDIAGPADEEMIVSAESQLGVRFPSEYRHFLRCYGAALGAGFNIAGIVVTIFGEQPLWDNVVRFTKSMRDSEGKIGKYDDLIALSNDGMDITFYLRTDKIHSGEVLAIGPGVEKVVAMTFNEFIYRISKGNLMQDIS